MTTGTPRPRAGRHEQACPSPVAALVMVALLAAPLTAQDRAQLAHAIGDVAIAHGRPRQLDAIA